MPKFRVTLTDIIESDSSIDAINMFKESGDYGDVNCQLMDLDLPRRLEIAEKKTAMINKKFSSGNDVEVERVTVRRDEWFE